MIKSIYIIIFLLLCSINLNAQDKYAHYFTSIGGTEYNLIEECGDTIVDNKHFKILHSSYYNLNSSDLVFTEIIGYTRQENDC